MTLGASSPDITEQMTVECGLMVKEIHCVTWRESKYVLISLDRSNRMRLSQMQTAMKLMGEKFRTVSSEIMGYESITTNHANDDGIEKHPGVFLLIFTGCSQKNNTHSTGFMQIIKMMQESKDQVRSYMRDEARKSQSFIQRYVGSNEIESMTKGQLLHTCRKWELMIKELQLLKDSHFVLGMQLREYRAHYDHSKKLRVQIQRLGGIPLEMDDSD